MSSVKFTVDGVLNRDLNHLDLMLVLTVTVVLVLTPENDWNPPQTISELLWRKRLREDVRWIPLSRNFHDLNATCPL